MSQHGCPERLSNRSKGFQEDGPSQPTMEVLVETLTGTAFEMTVSPSDTVFAIKSKIFRVEGIPISQQHLLYNLKELDDSTSLREHAISDGARLRLVLGMRGGPISTRRLPPPAPDHAEPWPDIERLLDSNREEGDWSGSGSGSGSGGCKVTVLVFRDGERVNMLRVQENRDGTYSPLDHAKYSSLTQLVEQTPSERAPGGPGAVGSGGPGVGGAGGPGAGAGALQENAVTQSKMMEIRRRMETLSLQRHSDAGRQGDKADIQKTRSEETLSVPSLLDSEPFERYSQPYEAEDTFTPLYDGNYTRYDYDCTFDRFTLPPLISPIGRPINDQTDEDLKLSDTLAGSILVKKDGAILEECIDSEECRLRQDTQLAAKSLAPISTVDYGPLVGGVSWRAAAPPPACPPSPPPPPAAAPAPPPAPAPRAPRAPHSHSASSLQLRAPPPAPRPPLSDALFSSSTSELEKLKRNSRILPALSRHRNREHLHLSDEGLHLRCAPRPAALRRQEPLRLEEFSEPAPAPVERTRSKRPRCAACRKRLSIATLHTCRCGAALCAPHRYAETHACACARDHRAAARSCLQRDNPRVAAPKLPEI